MSLIQSFRSPIAIYQTVSREGVTIETAMSLASYERVTTPLPMVSEHRERGVGCAMLFVLLAGLLVLAVAVLFVLARRLL